MHFQGFQYLIDFILSTQNQTFHENVFQKLVPDHYLILVNS